MSRHLTLFTIIGGGTGSSCQQALVEEPAAVEGPAIVEEPAAVEEPAIVEAVEEGATAEERGVSGCGHTLSCSSSGQYSLIWLYRYHCRSRESPEGGTSGGSCCADGDQVWSISREIHSLSESDSSLTSTEPCADSEMERWW